MDGRLTITVPVMKPLLPGGEFVLPYLKRGDTNRWHSNFGPLCMELESRLAARWGTKGASVLTLVNGTAGVRATLMAAGAAPHSLCLMPAWTFIATAHAATGAWPDALPDGCGPCHRLPDTSLGRGRVGRRPRPGGRGLAGLPVRRSG
ncbi:MAG: DegT/DnrJ/EryC1/StrS family aminotransferase [Rhodospirillaceae bacterium]|nr:DegT/DnrJ/EryC1/StrS family aminotransferase [Rhodospirillales bacterium]